MHVASDYVYVANRAGALPGDTELITTSFLNFCMPFLHYALGDHGSVLAERCDCGIHTPLMEVYGGSKYDFLEGREGIVHGAVLERIFQKIEGVRRYQIVQHSLESYTVRVEADPGCDRPGVMARVDEASRAVLTQVMERQVTVRLENPDQITPGRTGKYRFVYREPDRVGAP